MTTQTCRLFLPSLAFLALVGCCLAALPQAQTSDTVGATAQIMRITWSTAGDQRLHEELAQEMASALQRLYPRERFVPRAPASHKHERQIYLGTRESLARIPGAQALAKRLRGPESFVVGKLTGEKGQPFGVVLGADERGLIHGVYALLRRLGVGYTLNGDLVHVANTNAFDFRAWDFADRPLVPRRLVFNWHNFLSGCSSWNLEHWQRWILQAQKMGFNAIMVHAYGNNPMAGFPFQGVYKPVGYLSSTRLGRDWATMHVNDVRRLIGGEVFDGPVFGSTAAIAGRPEERIIAAQALMGRVFAFAEHRKMDVLLAVDMDTDSANPQALIKRLPEAARFAVGSGHDFWLARPDVPEGYRYYKAQLAHLLKVYPQLDVFVLWFRRGGTPLMRLKLEDLPPAWQHELRSIEAADPKAAKYWNRTGIFVLSKLAEAYQRALRELGRTDVELGLGSWGFDLLAAADRFMPADVALYPLDYEVLWKASRLESPGGPEGIAKVAAHRPVHPIHWAHHDDGTYVGPPYPPFEHFYDLLVRARCHTSGFGILHWTTRPLDLFFVGLSDAVWESSKNQPVQITCRRMARAMVGPRRERIFGQYLQDWLTGLPRIGRETTDFFIDRELKGYPEALQSHQQRMRLLDRIDTEGLSPVQRKRIAYFRGLERFVLGIFENEEHYREALRLQKQGDLVGARQALARTDVPGVIRGYVKTANLLGITRGEQGLVVSLNLRWLTHYLCLAQQLRAAPIRINYAPTVHDPLAQHPGRYTYFIDPKRRMWEVRGQAETKVPAFGQPAGWVGTAPHKVASEEDCLREVATSGLYSNQPFRLRISPMMNRKGHQLAAGRYRVTLVFGNPPETEAKAEACVVNLQIPGSDDPIVERLTLSRLSQPGHRFISQVIVLELTAPGIPALTLEPINGTVAVCGLVLEPLPSTSPREN